VFDPLSTSLKKTRGTAMDGGGLKVLYDWPNEQIQLIGLLDEQSYSLYSLSGMILKEGKGRKVNISDLEPGLYIIKVEDSSVRFIR
jgi:hypothetical protein